MLQVVIIQYLSGDFFTGHAYAVFFVVEDAVFNRKPNADGHRHKGNDSNEHTHNYNSNLQSLLKMNAAKIYRIHLYYPPYDFDVAMFTGEP
jgi:hypothetical protein